MPVDFDKDRIKSLKLVPVEATEILKTQKMQKKEFKGHRKGQNLTISVSLSSELYPAQKPVGTGLKKVLSNNGTRDQDVTLKMPYKTRD